MVNTESVIRSVISISSLIKFQGRIERKIVCPLYKNLFVCRFMILPLISVHSPDFFCRSTTVPSSLGPTVDPVKVSTPVPSGDIPPLQTRLWTYFVSNSRRLTRFKPKIKTVTLNERQPRETYTKQQTIFMSIILDEHNYINYN